MFKEWLLRIIVWQKPDVSNLKAFDFTKCIHLPMQARTKSDSKAIHNCRLCLY